MIPKKVIAFFDFIDFLDERKIEYIEKYIPLCNELESLSLKRNKLKPDKNYIEKQEYDDIQNEISKKFKPIILNIYKPITDKLLQLGIWAGDDTYSSIWNRNISAINDLKVNFTSEDVIQILKYKAKYLSFRKETNSNFLSLQLIFHELDEVLKVLFDFFKTTSENEFDSFEAKSIEVKSLKEAIEGFLENSSKNIKFTIPINSLSNTIKQDHKDSENLRNEFFMGDKIVVGDIGNNSGQIIIGKNINLSDSFNDKKETASKIDELIKLLREETNIEEGLRQSLITNFDKVRDEVLEEKPDKSRIFKWLTTTKGILENLVLSSDVAEIIQWLYTNLNFVF